MQTSDPIDGPIVPALTPSDGVPPPTQSPAVAVPSSPPPTSGFRVALGVLTSPTRLLRVVWQWFTVSPFAPVYLAVPPPDGQSDEERRTKLQSLWNRAVLFGGLVFATSVVSSITRPRNSV